MQELSMVSNAEIIEWMAYERIDGPFGGHFDDLRAVMGPAAIINTMRRMFGAKETELLDMRKLIPWYVPEPEKVLFDPSEPGYDAKAHGEALRLMLRSVSSNKAKS